MPRIRTVKPEMFTSESLAQVSVYAERTFVGLLTQADDSGRHRDNAAVICGLLWPLRPERTPFNVEEDLSQLAEAEVICRSARAARRRCQTAAFADDATTAHAGGLHSRRSRGRLTR